jgi:hypothetical protein
MADIWSHPTWFAKETMMQLENYMLAANRVHRGFEEEFSKLQNGWKIGDTISIKTPSYARVVDGPDLTGKVHDFYESTTTFQVDTWKSHAKDFTAQQMTWDLDRVQERIIDPAILALADYIDRDVLGQYKYIANQVGTPGQQLNDWLTVGLADARLTNLACPPGERSLFVDPVTKVYLASQLKGVFQQQMVGTAIQKAQFPSLYAGFDSFVSQNVPTHTPGSWAGLGTVLIDDTVADEDTNFTLDQNGAGSALTVKAGDVFTVASVNAVNPVNGTTFGENRQFVVTANGTFADIGGGSFELTPTIWPGTAPWNLRSSTAAAAKLPYQNIDTLPANNAAVSIPGTASTAYRVPLAFHKNCISLAMVPIVVPPSVVWSRSMSKNGFTFTVMRGLESILTLNEVIRFDVLYDLKVINPDLGCRIASA